MRPTFAMAELHTTHVSKAFSMSL